jgi:hypothetical protein
MRLASLICDLRALVLVNVPVLVQKESCVKSFLKNVCPVSDGHEFILKVYH